MDEEPESFCEHTRLAPPVGEAVEGAPGIAPVKSAEDTVPGETGPQGDGGGFGVADFPEEDDVGILAQIGPEGCGKGPANGLVDRALGGIGKGVFDRILNGEDLARIPGQSREKGTDSRCFATTGCSGRDHQSRIGTDGVENTCLKGCGDSEFGRGRKGASRSGVAEDEAFPRDGGDMGCTEGERLRFVPQFDSAILG